MGDVIRMYISAVAAGLCLAATILMAIKIVRDDDRSPMASLLFYAGVVAVAFNIVSCVLWGLRLAGVIHE